MARNQKTLQELREELGITISEMSRRVGISRAMIRFYEEGKHEPSVTVAARYAEELGITISELIQLLKKGA